MIDEYGKQVVELCGRLMKVMSINLGLGELRLQDEFGGENIGACLRVNFYPKCPQPELTLGLSSHSDPGGMTLLLADDNVAGLQVRRGNDWITVKPAPHAFIVNIGDQIQVTNALCISLFLYLFLFRFVNLIKCTWRGHVLMLQVTYQYITWLFSHLRDQISVDKRFHLDKSSPIYVLENYLVSSFFATFQ